MDVLKVWFSIVILTLGAWLFLQPPSFVGHLMILIWLVTAAVVFQLSKLKRRKLSKNEKLLALSFGILICIFSFINIQMGIGNPPYSIDDFSVLLVGATLIFLVFLGNRNLLLPSLIPFLAFLFFHLYDKLRSWLEVAGAPLEMPVVMISVFILKLLGVGVYSVENVIMFTTKEGGLLQVPIVFDCTGVESMGAFLLTASIVFYYFKKMPKDRRIMFLVVGIIGTYLANILRVVAICLSGYYYGYGKSTQLAHIHLGWITFAVWMLVYWTAFFVSYGKFKKRKGIYLKNEQK